MGKYAAFNAQLDIGTAQVETATVVGTITGDGNATVIITDALLVGSPLTTNVAVVTGDTADTVATKIIAGLKAVGAITTVFNVYGSGASVILRRKIAAANDATLNIDINNGTCTGLTDAPTSANTTAGVAKVEVAGVTNIGGPGLSVDVEDVTTHDQATAWEEQVATIVRSGEVSLDIVYDPAGATHDAATGLLYRLEDEILSYCDLIFRSTNNWTFFGHVVGFEPGGPVAGGLTASVRLKIAEAPTLE